MNRHREPALPAAPDGLLVAVDVGGTKTVVTAAPDGGPSTTVRFPTLGRDGDGRAAFANVLRAVAKVIADAGAGGPAYVGLVCPGHVTGDGIAMSPNLPGLERFDLRGVIAEVLPGHTVVIANDVRAAAFAELRSGALRDADPGLYVNLGTGVAAAVTSGGQVIAGAHGRAGEIGYARTGANGRTLEASVGGPGLTDQASRLMTDGTWRHAGDVLSSREPQLRELVDGVTKRLAECIAHLVLAVDPAKVAVGGGLMAEGDIVLGLLRNHVADLGGGSANVVAAEHVRDAATRGALELAAGARRQSIPDWAVVSR